MTDVPDRPRPAERTGRAPLPRWTVPVAAVVVLLTATVVLIVLWRWIDDLALADPEKRAAAHLDAVKVAASIAVGGGGVFALYLAARRQRTQEFELAARYAELAQRDRVQAHTEHVAETNRLHAERVAGDARLDAEARRITELYLKASEQLGSDKAPVRLAGLYALERLAQDNEGQRRTVVNVMCAYLRMPYPQPGDPPADDADEPARARYSDRLQEREVRLTTLGILESHLRPGDDPARPVDTFWPDTDLDLTGAVLIDLNLSHCRVGTVRFSGATLTGETWCREATFLGDAWFDGATFTGIARFGGATFSGHAWFDKAAFTGATWFGGVTFTGDAWFGGATFTGGALFSGAAFTGSASFGEATFANGTWFGEAMIAHPVSELSVWPPGWRPAEDHGVVEGREGTWHRVIQSGTEPDDPVA
ncbi:pentapeptide repeat-containing protein [Amycolatopsis sp. NPDC059021]|uniref:pentapeptide repeat-containing protein n=1 Tax=Amycolatopsis sp. NPDC059021 TaxID=3346704 RepID=UPI00366CCEAF